MIIKTLTMNAFSVNNYMLICEDTKEAVIIDAGGDYKATKLVLDEQGAALKYVLNTHGHLDHIAGDYDLQTKAGAKVLMNKEDLFLVDVLKSELKRFGMPEYEEPKVDEFVLDNQVIEFGNVKVSVIHTPGHSPGGVCYLVDNHLFSGDTLFYESVGRTDLPKSSYEQLKDSIQNKLFKLDDEVKVYPGHGWVTSIGHEKKNNPFFKIS